jgi:hypothetical protein
VQGCKGFARHFQAKFGGGGVEKGRQRGVHRGFGAEFAGAFHDDRRRFLGPAGDVLGQDLVARLRLGSVKYTRFKPVGIFQQMIFSQ